MFNIANFTMTDPGARARRAYDGVNALREDRARIQAGNALRDGDYGGGAAELFAAGLNREGSEVRRIGEDQRRQEAAAQKAKRDDALAYMGDVTERLMILNSEKDNPEETVAAFDQFFAKGLMERGETEQEIAQLRQGLSTKPRQTLAMLGGGIAKDLDLEIVKGSDGSYVAVNKKTGRPMYKFFPRAKPDWKERKLANGATEWFDINEGDQGYEGPGEGVPAGARTPDFNPQVQSERPPPNMGDIGPALTGRDAAGMMDALIAQESNGDGNAVGRQTPWGRALGSTQMLPATAEAMARKVGLPWRPDLMRGDTPAAMNYQRRLGQAYLQEGLDKYGGDLEKAFSYYHGGPDESIWGPKTRRYAAEMVERVTGKPYEVAALGDTPAPPSRGRTVRGDEPQPDKPLDRSQVFTQENQLRNQFGQQQAVKDLAAVRAHVSTIGAIANKARNGEPVTAADDLALIFAYMKMLDPGSVVREGEFANAQNTAGIPDRLRNMYNRALNGTRLSNAQRDEFFATASMVMDNYSTAYADQSDRSRSLATSYGLDPDRVAPAAKRPKPRGEGGGGGKKADHSAALTAARDAIRQGAPRNAVIKRLVDAGIDPKGL